MTRNNENGERNFDKESNWNHPEKIANDEYSSIMESFYNSVLRPIVLNGQRIDRDSLDMIMSELDWKIQDEGFKKLPLKIRNSYQSLFNLAAVLKKTDDATITKNIDILDGHFSLGICCTSYGDSMKDLYRGRNPCREEQVKMYSSLTKLRRNAENKNINLPLLEASGQMFDVCKKCPYK